MKDNFEIYFHLGLPKVASTYFQRIVFPAMKNVKFYKKHHFKHYKNLSTPKGKYLFSTERDRFLEPTLDEVYSHFPEARIILFFRRHDDWIVSRYKYHIRKFGALSFDQFIDLKHNKGYWKKEDLLYRKKIEYVERNGKYKPLILTFDEFKSDNEKFIQKVVNYMGTSYDPPSQKNKVLNKAFKTKQLIILRKFNNFYPYTKATYPYRIINKIHYKYREFLLHIIAFFALLTPASWTINTPLIEDDNQLEKIKEYYKEDWEFVKNY